MTTTRRRFLALAGGFGGTLALSKVSRAASVVTVEMRGTERGEKIWFSPRGLAVSPGTVVRFLNRDPVNRHTATSYHPDVYGRERRIPSLAAPWDTDFLLPGESAEVTLSAPGVYDYYCIPHEMAAMVGRIVVGTPEDNGWEGPAIATDDLSPDALAAVPEVNQILTLGRID